MLTAEQIEQFRRSGFVNGGPVLDDATVEALQAEVLRVIDSLQLAAKHQVATPVNWLPGEDVIIAGSVSDEEAKKRYPQGWKAPKPYLRIIPQPQ